ncbi:hypothetical protein [Vreelandella alkaliphila]|uniref:Uncharacterized protein n=1 Tax=Vreelandella alkaliphila TaxID=272774 RepID=A0AAJ2VVF9_9GAMM|nr:hypothetical protein [Halomonas alkaliphila]MDX5979585.1 hypothetical protein [Halomonas alkaliphila]
MAKLTKAEAAWLKKLQAVIDECPSKRLAAFTVGDARITLYDGSNQAQILAIQDANPSEEFGNAVEAADATLAHVPFPFQIHSVAG